MKLSDIAGATGDAESIIRLKFFELLFSDAKGYVCFATTDPRAPKSTFLQKFFEWPKDSLAAENWILKVKKNHNVYFCINMLDKMERKKDNCKPTNLLWADLDAVNPDIIQPPNIPPPIVIQSSPGRWQAIWRMSTIVSAVQAQDYSRRIAYSLAPRGADVSGWDLTQLLRVPLTTNFKYETPALVELERSLEAVAKPMLFETLPSVMKGHLTDLSPPPFEVEDDDPKSLAIVKKYMRKLSGEFIALLTYEPDEDGDWSKHLWKLMHQGFYAGMSREEVFAVASIAKCNKYKRDGRPVEHLWQDVCRASSEYQFIDEPGDLLSMPELVDAKASDTFLDKYREWATEITDAVPEYHDLCALVVLSAIVSSSLRIDSSIGDIATNIWGLILGESTATRKTTAMNHAMRFLYAIDPSLLVANDATSEGLITAIAQRPNKASIFHRDEVSGLFDTMARKDYMSGFQEVLTALYDVPDILTRQLRKETIIIESPAFIMLCGGVRDRIHSSTNESFVYSGFLPRFIVVAGEPVSHKPLGPSRPVDETKRTAILNDLADLYENYATPVEQRIGGVKTLAPPRYMARLTTEAWDAWNHYEAQLDGAALDSLIPNLALPTFNRMAKSILKISAILAATRQRPGEFASSSPSIVVDVSDVLNAAWYIQEWGKHSINLVINAGKSADERKMEQILDFIKEHPGVYRTDIMRRFHLKSAEGDILLGTLEQRGLVRKEQRHRGYAYWATS